jgi:hypothetical protein
MDDSSFIEQLCVLEERLLQPEVRRSVQELDMLLADDFMEIGSSGRTYNRQQIMDRLPTETIVEMTLMDFQAKLLAPGVALTTYRVVKQRDRQYSLRSSIWKWKEDRWQMVFHQGTPTFAP